MMRSPQPFNTVKSFNAKKNQERGIIGGTSVA